MSAFPFLIPKGMGSPRNAGNKALVKFSSGFSTTIESCRPATRPATIESCRPATFESCLPATLRILPHLVESMWPLSGNASPTTADLDDLSATANLGIALLGCVSFAPSASQAIGVPHCL